MDLKSEALELDHEAAELAGRSQSTFIAIGRVMDRMTDDLNRWALLIDPRTGKNYHSQESWIAYRFRSQRATAFSARTVFRQLKATVPIEVMEKSEPGSLKIMAMLPESAQRSPEIQKLVTSSTPNDFTDAVMELYPEELIEKHIRWGLHPTLSQAALYDRVIERIQKVYSDAGVSVGREECLEYALHDAEERMEELASDLHTGSGLSEPTGDADSKVFALGVSLELQKQRRP